jgi:hypothetical protein
MALPEVLERELIRGRILSALSAPDAVRKTRAAHGLPLIGNEILTFRAKGASTKSTAASAAMLA